jgi:hypothetical protein
MKLMPLRERNKKQGAKCSEKKASTGIMNIRKPRSQWQNYFRPIFLTDFRASISSWKIKQMASYKV